MAYHGQMSLQIGILVAFTQIIPEHQVQVLGVFKARVKVRVLGPFNRYTDQFFRPFLWHILAYQLSFVFWASSPPGSSSNLAGSLVGYIYGSTRSTQATYPETHTATEARLFHLFLGSLPLFSEHYGTRWLGLA